MMKTISRLKIFLFTVSLITKKTSADYYASPITDEPSSTPSTASPTKSMTPSISPFPTIKPSSLPSLVPTKSPSPSAVSSAKPSASPSTESSVRPSTTPSVAPSSQPFEINNTPTLKQANSDEEDGGRSGLAYGVAISLAVFSGIVGIIIRRRGTKMIEEDVHRSELELQVRNSGTELKVHEQHSEFV